jgi:hypothetical protein
MNGGSVESELRIHLTAGGIFQLQLSTPACSSSPHIRTTSEVILPDIILRYLYYVIGSREWQTLIAASSPNGIRVHDVLYYIEEGGSF